MRKSLLAFVLAAGLTAAPIGAQVVVHVAPPPVVVEHPGPPPARGYVWVPGYHRWDGVRYVWVPGRYSVPPRARAIWVPGHWAARRGGWVFVAGRWR